MKYFRFYFLIFFIGFLTNCDQKNHKNSKVSLGKEVFTKNCKSCHDSSNIGPDLAGRNLDISNIILQVKYGGYGMPGFEDVLTEEEIENVSQYIYNLN
tara:strand:+ start:172 stop:465 length:294 start_codon:yes stop_codon:yes gene_type:complete